MAFWRQNKKTSAPSPTSQPGVGAIKHIIAIASGKGGVGKSTIATNLAAALAVQGYRVGLMDADIYGPTQPTMLGATNERATAPNGMIQPVTKHGVHFMSMGLLTSGEGPLVWRAPMATKAIQEFIANVAWGELDFLLIDLPPGTGDVQLTLAQNAALTGAVIVTTPQTVALNVAQKGLQMFQKVNVPILGVIENMSGFTCGHCGKTTPIFKIGGGRALADSRNVSLLGEVPLDPAVMASGEEGIPVVTTSQDSPIAKVMLSVASTLTAAAKREAGASEHPKHVSLTPDNRLLIHWPDGHVGEYTAYALRLRCVCAACVDEATGKKRLDPATVPLDITAKSVRDVGRYGFQIYFSDDHSTGIYTFDKLRAWCECAQCLRQGREGVREFTV